MALNQNYYNLWFHSFMPSSQTGHRDPIQLKLVPGQTVPEEIIVTCDERELDPFSLLTECDKSLFYDYPLGTHFLLKAKLTDREGRGTFFYSSYKWPPLEVNENA